ncbi:MAG: 2-oxoacid:acceptor oxidoreductase subunit alpha [Planctomycetota bacterium]
MDLTELVVGIGGAAGDGQGTAGDALARTAARLGLHAYAYNSYQSAIRGGHIWFRVRLGYEKVLTHGERLDVLVALNQDTLRRHAGEIAGGGVAIFNADKLQPPAGGFPPGVKPLALSIAALAKENNFAAELAKLPILQNTIATGAVVHLVNLHIGTLEELLADTYGHKGPDVVALNIKAARAGFAFARKTLPPLDVCWDYEFKKRPYLTGNDAIALGAAAAGCKFYAAYPMTPATGILHWMADHGRDLGILVKQSEDEIAAIAMAIGAGHAGVRAMTGSSGGGFALMTEAVGMAAMTETPIVIAEVQRGGPSTGLPTKTEQGDLNQVLGASQGDYPRIVIAPADLPDCFDATVEAFHLAERWQCPVFILSDLLLSEHGETAEPDRFRFPVRIDRGLIYAGEAAAFRRYQITENGVSTRVFPGREGTEFVAASDEHDERGILISDFYTNPALRKKMMEKRMRKMTFALRELPPPALEGPADADATLVSWGSTRGVITEVIPELLKRGITVNRLHFRYIVPFHATEATAILNGCRKAITVENNFTGQFARHLAAEPGFRATGRISKYDGEPFEPHHIVAGVSEILAGKTEYAALTPQDGGKRP